MLTFMLPWIQIKPSEQRVLFSERTRIPPYGVVGHISSKLLRVDRSIHLDPLPEVLATMASLPM